MKTLCAAEVGNKFAEVGAMSSQFLSVQTTQINREVGGVCTEKTKYSCNQYCFIGKLISK